MQSKCVAVNKIANELFFKKDFAQLEITESVH